MRRGWEGKGFDGGNGVFWFHDLGPGGNGYLALGNVGSNK